MMRRRLLNKCLLYCSCIDDGLSGRLAVGGRSSRLEVTKGLELQHRLAHKIKTL